MDSDMNRVLIVDDEPSFLTSLSVELEEYVSLELVTAENGKQALDVLGNTPVDVVVTDLKMPVMDGFELLSELTNKHPDIPVIVMSAYASREAKTQIRSYGTTICLEKPIVLDELVSEIFDALNRDTRGFIRAISIPAFLQLIEMERMTSTLSIVKGNQFGTLSFFKGRLTDARVGDMVGDEAAMNIISWEHGNIELENNCRAQSQTVKSTLSFLTMEAMRQSDEESIDEAFGDELAFAVRESGTHNILRESGTQNIIKDSGIPLLLDQGAENQAPITESQRSGLSVCIQQIQSIYGYRASILLYPGGETIFSDAVDQEINLNEIKKDFHHIFRTTCNISSQTQFESCTESRILTNRGILSFRTIALDQKNDVHLMVILANDGNAAHLKLRTGKIAPQISRILNETNLSEN